MRDWYTFQPSFEEPEGALLEVAGAEVEVDAGAVVGASVVVGAASLVAGGAGEEEVVGALSELVVAASWVVGASATARMIRRYGQLA